VSGRVAIPGADKELPVAGLMVTLHRVGPDTSGAVDSVRTDAQGRYAIRYHRVGADDAIYFAAAIYRGIAYFSAPLRSARVSGEEGEITVFDTTSRPVELHIRGHHLVVGSPRPNGMRDIVEVWELSNDTTVTVIGRDSLAPIWSAPLPRGAMNVSGGQGDVAVDALVTRGERVTLRAAFGPGVKQISYSYSVAPKSFPLVVPIEHPTSILEVLLEEPTAQVTGGALKSMAAATTQGRTFKRFLGQDVAVGNSLRVTVPAASAITREYVLIALGVGIALVMAGALARALMRRGDRGGAALAAPRVTDALVASIALLDARRERGDSSLSEEAYSTERSALKSQLSDALAAETRTA
jgi:hypothetical protein